MVIIMKYMMVRKQDKGTENLYNLYKQYGEEVTFNIEYVATGIDANFTFVIAAELRKVSFHDASICVFDIEEDPCFFDLYYIMDDGDKNIYEHFLFETFHFFVTNRILKS